MPTVDLSTPPPPSTGLLESLPRRVTLTLPELRLVAERAGGAPLPFDDRPQPAPTGVEDRPGRSGPSAEDAAYDRVLRTLHDPEATLARRGLLDGGARAAGVLGAVGLLATPTTAVDIDVAAGETRATAWHRHDGSAVAALATVDGVVFELAWFDAAQWASELGRVGALPEDLPVRASGVPAHVEIPFELADAAAEAVRGGRADLLPVLAAKSAHPVRDGDGRPLPAADVPPLLLALTGETRGRLRALVADLSEGEAPVAGVVSWTLLSDGWHALRPRHPLDGTHRVVVTAVEPSDLPVELAPVLAEVAP